MSVAENALWALWDYAGRETWGLIRWFGPVQETSANDCDIAVFADGSRLIRDHERGAWRAEEARSRAPRVPVSSRPAKPVMATDPEPERK